MKFIKRFITGLLMFLVLTPMALAQDNEEVWLIRVGGAAIGVDIPWKGLEAKGTVLPYISATYGNWTFGVEHLVKYQIDSGDSASAFVGINLRDVGYNSDYSLIDLESDDPVFRGYDSPKPELVAQMGVSWHILSASLEQDVSNRSQSYAAKASIDIPLFRSKRGVMVKGSVGANWLSEEYVNYYYGINKAQQDEVRGRTLYTAEEAINYEAKINMLYPITRHLAIMASLSRTQLDEQISNSPLLDGDVIDQVMVNVSYQF